MPSTEHSTHVSDQPAKGFKELAKRASIVSSGPTSVQVVWFKRDLRTFDHGALLGAIQAGADVAGGVLCLYVHEPSATHPETAPEASRQHSMFLRECLDDLSLQLKELGGEILEVVGEAVEVFEKLRVHLLSSGCSMTIWAHQETTGGRDFARDRAVLRWCREQGIAIQELQQNAVVRWPRRDEHHGEAFKKHLEAACDGDKPLVGLERKDCEGAWATLPWPSASQGDIPQAAGEDRPGRVRGGRAQALKRLSVFTQFDRLASYPKKISSPSEAEEGCSRLSPHLSYGTLSDREVLRAVNDAANLADARLPKARAEWVQKASAFFAQRVYWRSGYLQMLETHPELEWGGDVQGLVGLRESEFEAEGGQERFDRWASGRTGFPMIDASMRMLHETGWTNMRMRGMLASFALNELWLPPRQVGLHLARLFLDLEPAIHWGQIAIHAGTLSGSRPLVYNPTKQAQDQDPSGAFIKRWVAELQGVPAEHIIEPWLMTREMQAACGCRVGEGGDYPMAIVDFRAASKCAKDRVYALREGKADPGGLPYSFGLDTRVSASKAKSQSDQQQAQLDMF